MKFYFFFSNLRMCLLENINFLKHILPFLLNEFWNFMRKLFGFFALLFNSIDEYILNDGFKIAKAVYLFLYAMDVVVHMHLSDTFELVWEDFDDIASDWSEIPLSNGDFLLICFFVESIQSGLQLQGFFEGIQEIVHFITIIENDFMAIVDIAVELFQFIHVFGFELKHFLNDWILFAISFLILQGDELVVDCLYFFPV